jgi:hypothetical protein
VIAVDVIIIKLNLKEEAVATKGLGGKNKIHKSIK